jgi:hypothetical protein
MADVDGLTYDKENLILQSKDFIEELCTCLVKLDESSEFHPRLRLAHYTVKEYLYSDRIKYSKVGYFHCSNESAAFIYCMTSILYLLNISYVCVPSTLEYFTAEYSAQQKYKNAVNKSFPFLNIAMFTWEEFYDKIHDPLLQGKIDHLLFRLFWPRKPHILWWVWSVVMFRNVYYPIWEVGDNLESNIAFGIACSLNKPRVAAMIFQNDPAVVCTQT